MPHRCYGGCGTYISDDKKYCTACEKARCEVENIADEEQQEETETGESSYSISQDT